MDAAVVARVVRVCVVPAVLPGRVAMGLTVRDTGNGSQDDERLVKATSLEGHGGAHGR